MPLLSPRGGPRSDPAPSPRPKASVNGAPIHKGLLAKEKEKKLAGQSTGFNQRFFVVEPGLLLYFDTSAQWASLQPAKGSMVLDKATVLSNLKHARAGRPHAFRLDRLTSGAKEKYVLAATDQRDAEVWLNALRQAGVSDELRDDFGAATAAEAAAPPPAVEAAAPPPEQRNSFAQQQEAEKAAEELERLARRQRREAAAAAEAALSSGPDGSVLSEANPRASNVRRVSEADAEEWVALDTGGFGVGEEAWRQAQDAAWREAEAAVAAQKAAVEAEAARKAAEARRAAAEYERAEAEVEAARQAAKAQRVSMRGSDEAQVRKSQVAVEAAAEAVEAAKQEEDEAAEAVAEAAAAAKLSRTAEAEALEEARVAAAAAAAAVQAAGSDAVAEPLVGTRVRRSSSVEAETLMRRLSARDPTLTLQPSPPLQQKHPQQQNGAAAGATAAAPLAAKPVATPPALPPWLPRCLVQCVPGVK